MTASKQVDAVSQILSGVSIDTYIKSVDPKREKYPKSEDEKVAEQAALSKGAALKTDAPPLTKKQISDIAFSMAIERSDPEQVILEVKEALKNKDPNKDKDFFDNAKLFLNTFICANMQNDNFKALRQYIQTPEPVASKDKNIKAYQILINELESKDSDIAEDFKNSIAETTTQKEKDKVSVQDKQAAYKQTEGPTDDMMKRVSKARTKRQKSNLVKDVANDLKHAHMKMWLDVTTDDFMQEGSSFTAISKDFQDMTDMAAEDILLAPSPKEQKKIFEFYLDLADECFKQGDFHSGQAIFQAINSNSAVTRLQLENGLSKERKEKITELASLTDLTNNNSSIRSAINGHKDSAVVPLPDLIIKDIALTREGNQETVLSGFINTDLNRFLGENGARLADFQNAMVNENIPPITTNIASRVSQPHLAELFQHERSKMLKSSGTADLLKKFPEVGKFKADRLTRQHFISATKPFTISTDDDRLSNHSDKILAAANVIREEKIIQGYNEILSKIDAELKEIQRGNQNSPKQLESLITEANKFHSTNFPIPTLEKLDTEKTYQKFKKPLPLEGVNKEIGKVNSEANRTIEILADMKVAIDKHKVDIQSHLDAKNTKGVPDSKTAELEQNKEIGALFEKAILQKEVLTPEEIKKLKENLSDGEKALLTDVVDSNLLKGDTVDDVANKEDAQVELDGLEIPADMKQDYPPITPIAIGPGVGQAQKIGSEAPHMVVPPLNLAAVKPRIVPSLDLDEVKKADDPTPKMPRGLPTLDLSQLQEKKIDTAAPQEQKQEQQQDAKVEHKHSRKHKEPTQEGQSENKQRRRRKHKSDEPKQEGQKEHKQRRRRKHKSDEPAPDIVGESTHMNAQYTSMLQRHQQQSEKDWSPTLAAQQKQESAATAKNEEPRPRAKVGGLTALFEAKIKQQAEEKGRGHKVQPTQPESNNSKEPESNNSKDRRLK
tara:strand:+ start:98360 stop:101215 length:2856 start_codon:yes stop_codon:yes gene_type:complete